MTKRFYTHPIFIDQPFNVPGDAFTRARKINDHLHYEIQIVLYPTSGVNKKNKDPVQS